MDDICWMKEAMSEAAKGGRTTHPNPMVGAVLARDGIELGRGYHRRAGMPHAEIEALRNAEANGFGDVSGATLYVTMEPCNHYGRTPPCTEALIGAKIKRCVIGTRDPNHHVRGGGVERLEAAGISCSVGLCQKELVFLNRAFFTASRFGRPYITAKWAMSADGKIATRTGHSQWVTGDLSRRDVHEQRAQNDAVMVGTQTACADNPQLSVRHAATDRQPLRVILDRRLRIPPDARVFDTAQQRTVLFTTHANAESARGRRNGAAVESVDECAMRSCGGDCNGDALGLDLDQVFRILAERYDVTTLYCEGGAELLGQLRDKGFIDECHIYIAPKIVGGRDALGAMTGFGAQTMDDASVCRFDPPVLLGGDIKLVGYIDRLTAACV